MSCQRLHPCGYSFTLAHSWETAEASSITAMLTTPRSGRAEAEAIRNTVRLTTPMPARAAACSLVC